MDYNTMRVFADSWGLLFLVLVFVGVILFTLRPGAGKRAEEAARIPLNDE
jgi:cytochrome c oxidase cbb3-type subunit 4